MSRWDKKMCHYDRLGKCIGLEVKCSNFPFLLSPESCVDCDKQCDLSEFIFLFVKWA